MTTATTTRVTTLQTATCYLFNSQFLSLPQLHQLLQVWLGTNKNWYHTVPTQVVHLPNLTNNIYQTCQQSGPTIPISNSTAEKPSLSRLIAIHQTPKIQCLNGCSMSNGIIAKKTSIASLSLLHEWTRLRSWITALSPQLPRDLLCFPW